MSRSPVYAVLALLASAVLSVPVRGQAVISTRAGLVHFFEGAVFVAGQPLETRFGRFTSIPEGAELSTEQGRAEVLLTPGVFLRVGEKSTIRLISSNLADTRVELLRGSAIVDSLEPSPGTSITVIYKAWNVRQPGKGAYRIDCDPPRLEVRAGEVKVAAANGGAPVSVEHGMDLPLAEVLVPEQPSGETHDTLSDWAEGRAQSISTDNAIAANIQDPANMQDSTFAPDGFTYFPMLGYSALGLSSLYNPLSPYSYGMYGALSPYQLGFYSLYLLGYTRAPLSIGLPFGVSRPVYLPPSRVGYPGSPSRPVVVPHPVPHGVGHVGGRR